MLAQNQPELPDINERKWAKAAGDAGIPFRESFEAFSLERKNLLRVPDSLTFEAWEKSALIFGRKHAVFTQVRRIAKHEHEHGEQIVRLFRHAPRR
jgi:hypothetical protein